MSQPIIEVKNLSKVYRLGTIGATSLKEEWGRLTARIRGNSKPREKEEFWALRDVSFQVGRGEVLGIIGRNGAGKSTLLKILSRITQQTSGEITLRGRVASLLEVGTGFHPDLTGRDNIFLNGAILGMKKAEIRRKLDEIVAFAEVEQFIDTPVKRYSSGMYVRLAFAVAAHLEPEILIVDEVLAVGDMQFQKKCLGKMEQVSREFGRTVIFVSHNMGVIANICQRVMLLRAGSLAADGPPSRIIASYIGEHGSKSAEVSWRDDPAARSDRVALLSARIVSSGELCGDIAIDRPMTLEIEIEALRQSGNMASSIHLYDKQGVWVLCSGTKSETLTPGRYRHRYHFPANFFNDGRYSFDIILVRDANHHEVFMRDAIPFFVHETGKGREEFGGVINGCIRPLLNVETEACLTAPIASEIYK